MKTLNNANVVEAKRNTSDLQICGNGDLWQLLCKASSKREGWMKSTKVMEIEDPHAACGTKLIANRG